jgi:hypothetical protein
MPALLTPIQGQWQPIFVIRVFILLEKLGVSNAGIRGEKI